MGDAALAFIFARGGSKGIPGKNITPLGGKPLIAHSIEQALSHPDIGRVVVSTDDTAIAAVARDYGAEVPFLRPAELASDTASEWLAWQHAVTFCLETGYEFSTFISLPTTAPLRNHQDISACLDRYRIGDVDLVLTGTPAARSPYFNMVKTNGEGLVELAVPGAYRRRQDAPTLFDLTTVAYVSSPQFILTADSLWAGRVALVTVPRERAIDIDEPLDLYLAECLYQRALTSAIAISEQQEQPS